jgi:protein-S-isoprenylcysteine O-methyltransferase Ste14
MLREGNCAITYRDAGQQIVPSIASGMPISLPSNLRRPISHYKQAQAVNLMLLCLGDLSLPPLLVHRINDLITHYGLSWTLWPTSERSLHTLLAAELLVMCLEPSDARYRKRNRSANAGPSRLAEYWDLSMGKIAAMAWQPDQVARRPLVTSGVWAMTFS